MVFYYTILIMAALTSPTEPSTRPPITPLNRSTFVAEVQTPFKAKERTNAIFRSDQPNMQQRYDLIAKETRGAYRVGIPVQDFFKEYMPWNEETIATYKTKQPDNDAVEKLISMADCKTEAQMYPVFVSYYPS